MLYKIQIQTLPEQLAIVKRASPPPGELISWLPTAYQELFAYVAKMDAIPAGPRFGRYTVNGGAEVEAGVPLTGWLPDQGDLVMSWFPATQAVTTLHVGPYWQAATACAVLQKWIDAHGHERSGPHWEVYLTDPATEPDPARARTLVVMPYSAPGTG